MARKAATPRTGTAKADSGNADVQATVDAENEAGFRGVEVDETPNENYTVAGVLAGKPTPENTRVPGERTPVHAIEDGKVVRK